MVCGTHGSQGRDFPALGSLRSTQVAWPWPGRLGDQVHPNCLRVSLPARELAPSRRGRLLRSIHEAACFKYLDKLEADHPKIEAQCQKVKQAIEELTEGDSLDELIVEWKKYGDMIGPHMDEEEATALLLLRAYFKPEDLKPVIEYIM